MPSIGPISRLYEQFTRGPGPQIVVQDIDYESLGLPVLNPDVTGDELDRQLRQQVPLANRLLMRASLPVAGLAARLMGAQLPMDRNLGLEDLPTAEQEQWADRCQSSATGPRTDRRPHAADVSAWPGPGATADWGGVSSRDVRNRRTPFAPRRWNSMCSPRWDRLRVTSTPPRR